MGGISNSCYLSMTFTLRLLLSYFHDGLLTNFSQMKNAPNNPLIHGEIADYYLDYNGILISYSKNIKRTIANITANIELVKSITQNKKVPLLIYLSKSPIPSRKHKNLLLLSCHWYILLWPWFLNRAWLN